MRNKWPGGIKLLCCCLACWGGVAWRAAPAPAAPAQAVKIQSARRTVRAKPQPTQTADRQMAAGTKAFVANCGRCHNPPQELSPRAAGAVVRQMRVRGMLSAQDARLILQFLAP